MQLKLIHYFWRKKHELGRHCFQWINEGELLTSASSISNTGEGEGKKIIFFNEGCILIMSNHILIYPSSKDEITQLGYKTFLQLMTVFFILNTLIGIRFKLWRVEQSYHPLGVVMRRQCLLWAYTQRENLYPESFERVLKKEAWGWLWSLTTSSHVLGHTTIVWLVGWSLLLDSVISIIIVIPISSTKELNGA